LASCPVSPITDVSPRVPINITPPVSPLPVVSIPQVTNQTVVPSQQPDYTPFFGLLEKFKELIDKQEAQALDKLKAMIDKQEALATEVAEKKNVHVIPLELKMKLQGLMREERDEWKHDRMTPTHEDKIKFLKENLPPKERPFSKMYTKMINSTWNGLRGQHYQKTKQVLEELIKDEKVTKSTTLDECYAKVIKKIIKQTLAPLCERETRLIRSEVARQLPNQFIED